MVKNLSANAGDTGDPGLIPLNWEDPLEKEMATHYSILAWEIPWTEEPGGLQSMRLQDTTEQLDHTTTSFIIQRGLSHPFIHTEAQRRAVLQIIGR